ncbi:caleosin family protein [Pendulispora albinea]|uniref:Caleosin family protein n=1 Tax=Pendulispora albinea TaxID=2741071 RepID=A0ABZ2MBV3_9BACT
MTPLQRHAQFFDPERTGIITPRKTFRGLGRLGIGWHLGILLTPLINGFLGYLTTRKITFDIVIESIASGKHPYDTGVFDDEGQFDQAAFDALFAGVSGDAITEMEMRRVIVGRGNRRAHMGDLAGKLGLWFSGKEVKLLFCVASDTTKSENGKTVPAIRKRTMRRFYDGTLLDAVARARIWRGRS